MCFQRQKILFLDFYAILFDEKLTENFPSLLSPGSENQFPALKDPFFSLKKSEKSL